MSWGPLQYLFPQEHVQHTGTCMQCLQRPKEHVRSEPVELELTRVSRHAGIGNWSQTLERTASILPTDSSLQPPENSILLAAFYVLSTLCAINLNCINWTFENSIKFNLPDFAIYFCNIEHQNSYEFPSGHTCLKVIHCLYETQRFLSILCLTLWFHVK